MAQAFDPGSAGLLRYEPILDWTNSLECFKTFVSFQISITFQGANVKRKEETRMKSSIHRLFLTNQTQGTITCDLIKTINRSTRQSKAGRKKHGSLVSLVSTNGTTFSCCWKLERRWMNHSYTFKEGRKEKTIAIKPIDWWRSSSIIWITYKNIS